METSVDPNAFLSPSIRTFRLFPALVYLRRARARVSRSRKCVSRMCVRAQCQGSGRDGGRGGVGVYSAAFRTTLEFPWSSSRQARIKIVDPRILFYSLPLKLPFFFFFHVFLLFLHFTRLRFRSEDFAKKLLDFLTLLTIFLEFRIDRNG